MNKIFNAFFIQAFTSRSAHTQIQTIALYSTVKNTKFKFQTKYKKTESNYLLLLLLPFITLSIFPSMR